MALGWPRRRDRTGLAIFLLLALAACSFESRAAELYQFAPAAPWVTVASPAYDAPVPQGGTSGGVQVLLLDRQIRVHANGDDDFYYHYAARPLNETGVDNRSQIDLLVDPTYQSVDLHMLQIVRGRTVIDARKSARITALPLETQLQNRIYDGRYNINILLSDVRPGDVIEYSYTIHSRQKLFPGHFATQLSTAWSTPVHWQRIRVLTPRERLIHARLSDGSPPPPFQVRGATRELLLEWHDTPAIPSESNVPAWFSQWPYLELSDLKDWDTVSRLVYPLYAKPLQGGAEVNAIAAQIKALGGPAEEQALRALQFVQEQIRYTSIAIGPGSHRPSSPREILERRYGDCKDKSVLLVALLRALGIEASPALVHSRTGRTLPESLPTPYAFDHVIVRIQIGDKVYWVDGTEAVQHLPLAADEPADFEHALVVAPSGAGLEPIPRPAPNSRRREVFVELDLEDGIDKPGTLTVTTRYIGRHADEMRPVLANVDPEQRKSDYANYIARYYPSAKPAGEITIEDNKSTNVIRVHERYILDPVFTKNAEDILELALHPNEIYQYLEPLSSSVRRAPLALEYPIQVQQHIVVLLPEPWLVKPETLTIENPAFRYRSKVDYAAKVLDVNYEYEALADHVDPASLGQYLADRSRAFDTAGYALTYNPNALTASAPAIAPLPSLVLLLSLALSVWAAFRWLYRYDPEPRQTEPDWPAGIAGWLLIPALIAILSACDATYVMVAWVSYLSADTWNALPGLVTEPYRMWVRPVVLAITGCSIALFVACLLLLVLFFRQRTSAPYFFVAVLWLRAIFKLTVETWSIASGMPHETTLSMALGMAIRSGIAGVLWTAYMIKSRRVKATFRNRLSKADAQLPQAQQAAA